MTPRLDFRASLLQIFVVHVLASAGPLEVADLQREAAERFGHPPNLQGLYNVVYRLVAAGLATAETLPPRSMRGGKSRSRYSLTEGGRAYLAALGAALSPPRRPGTRALPSLRSRAHSS